MQVNVAIYSHVLLRIYIIGGQRSVKIAPLSLPAIHHSGQIKNPRQDRSSMIYVVKAGYHPLPLLQLLFSGYGSCILMPDKGWNHAYIYLL